MAVTVAELLKISQAQLDDLFTQSPTGEIPTGEATGTAIIAPGTTYTQEMAKFVNHFAWQGKIFDPAKGSLRNKILPFGLNAIISKVYKGASWMDGKECIVLDLFRDFVGGHIGSATRSAKSRRRFISAKFIWAKSD